MCRSTLGYAYFISDFPFRISTAKITLPLYEGKSFSVGSKEIELDRAISQDSFLSGTCFGQSLNAPTASSTSLSNGNAIRKFTAPSLFPNVKKPSGSDTTAISPSTNSYANHENTFATTNSPEATNYPLYWTVNW